MKYGCRAHDFGTHPAEEFAALLQERGYNAAQLAMPKAIAGITDQNAVTPAQLEEIRAAFTRHDIEITVLSCYRDLSNPDAEARLQAVEDVGRTLVMQRTLGAGAVGSESATRDLSEEEKAALRPLLADSVLRIVEKAARVGGVFALEPVFVHTLGTVEALRALIDQVADPVHFKVIFDPVNVLHAGVADRQAEFWPAWIETIGPRLAAVHVKDARFPPEGPRVPTALGEGQMDYTLIRAWLHADHPDAALLRDEVILPAAARDLAYMKAM